MLLAVAGVLEIQTTQTEATVLIVAFTTTNTPELLDTTSSCSIRAASTYAALFVLKGSLTAPKMGP